ncbi:type I glyceraldehyde-3-phosphate dehydrogenase [Pseudonocardia sp. KRD-184]|uniref:Type I glyceraldehyde-3-phosphate dehydrogenase n=1 Tax=Pseudonocardia oceani TaxID=2792013 RepID=A0ABS6UHP6_9PSEU|nr:type I glyceraldehyde-3-phosphate dehydrogenase [Pseudonocardia oceani]MBW0090269.1 type I glyceraldehyde-3-phosphate dehydrogenase [Pseudonocardia oceani]MBW0097475.1 type I glyceraldehyde-3-phosphate dehydrogenase [Pseudonocardia oceani]MBW0110104.1 type I glyceraldehyde-3-phosphate dehydrogenase [Pseudonocardia oceani]MBW0122255.1 type I glyceraldehyde-3-phosphate dehydrogenase [Pseudonocardia oceani]MBW0131763.1 type I glyceraldehyde-3-phosphate dehydrogenase [Pseudonocardia oceani]
MRVRVGINGMGRIGRDVLRASVDRHDPAFEIVAVNDVAPAATTAHLLRHDSTYGTWPHRLELSDDFIAVDDHAIRTTQESDPTRLDWDALGVDVVVEATGRFRGRADVTAHLAAGARKVIVTAPGHDLDTTIVMGVNQDVYDATAHHLVSNASCTTNCAAPMAQVLHGSFGIEEGLLTTVHSYTGDQNLLDGQHADLRRARSAAVNIIPTGTGAARAVGEVIPELAGRLDAVALRVPVVDASIVDLTVRLAREVTVGQVNRAFLTAADGVLKGILRCTDEPIVSHDVIGEASSCVIDLGLTRTVGSTAKVFGWYDNEWGYAQRTLDLLDMVARTMPAR